MTSGWGHKDHRRHKHHGGPKDHGGHKDHGPKELWIMDSCAVDLWTIGICSMGFLTRSWDNVENVSMADSDA